MMVKNREPWLAVLWSRIWPGLGAIYAGAMLRGLATALSSMAITIASLLAFLGRAGLSIQIGLGSALLLGLINIWSWFDAYGVTRKRNSAEFETARRSQKDPWQAVFWTTLLLGAGHIYIRRYVFGAALIAIGVLGFVIPLAWLLLPFLAVHAYRSTPGLTAGSITKKRVIHIVLVAWLLPILLGALPAWGLRTFVMESRYIPSGAMSPTLQKSDRLLISKLDYRLAAPQRGDIILFNAPDEIQQRENYKAPFMMRIVGLPNESVEVKQGKVFIDGEALNETYLLEPPGYEWSAADANLAKTIPPGHYFVLGDNRNDSYDSRFWGYLPQDKLIGKATQRFWPASRMGTIESENP